MRKALAVLCALLAVSGSLRAQDAAETDGDYWYAIELLIFANRDPAALLEERWEPLPELAYPQRWRRLDNASALVDPTTRSELVLVEDTLPVAFIDLYWNTPLDELWRQARILPGLRKPQYSLEPLLDLRVPRPHTQLSETEHQLRDQRRRINRNGGLEVLWHQRWRQRIPELAKSTPILIESGQLNGGNRRGDFPELQGSVLFYSGRYLHIATNFWLNTDGDYLDTERATMGWRMPPPPAPPQDREVGVPRFQLQPAPYWLAQPEATDIPENTISVEPDSGEVVTEDIDAQARREMMAAFEAAPVVDYPFRHAVLVKQQRRMRSDELHYIDHPLLGVLVRISPVTFPPFVSPEGQPLPADTR
ncbi:MAG: CsiV family protein [Pseudomonadota bacterium]